jgi:hypothetical protein
MRAHNLLFQQIILIEENHERGIPKVRIIDDSFEKVSGFHQAIPLPSLLQNLVILRNGGQKNYRGYVFKAFNPFFPFTSLAADIDNSEEVSLGMELVFY